MTRGGPCESCKSQSDRARGTSTQRGHGSARWQRLRRWFLAHYPTCGERTSGISNEHSECVREGRVTVATDVDHIIPTTGPESDPDFFNPEKLQALCGACHRRKTNQQGGRVNRPT